MQNTSNVISTRINNLPASQNYVLPTASSTVLGGIRVGTNLTITSGLLSATYTIYSLPTASATVLGGIRVGINLRI